MNSLTSFVKAIADSLGRVNRDIDRSIAEQTDSKKQLMLTNVSIPRRTGASRSPYFLSSGFGMALRNAPNAAIAK